MGSYALRRRALPAGQLSHTTHNPTTQIYNWRRLRRATESGVFILLGDSSATSNVADGLFAVRGEPQTSRSKREYFGGADDARNFSSISWAFILRYKGFLGHFKSSDSSVDLLPLLGSVSKIQIL